MNSTARRFPLLAILFLLVSGTALAQERQPLIFDDLISFARVSDPQISSDGRWVAYVVEHHNKATNARTSDLWLVRLAGGEPQQLTRSGKRDRRPRWSPDGSRLAFLSNRDGRWQIWTIAVAGGEAHKLVDLPLDVDGLLWSPDGNWLAFTAEVYPDCPAAEALACTARRDAERDKSLVKARLYDGLLYRHWNAWDEGKRSHLFVIRSDGSGPARDLTPGPHQVPPLSLGGPDDYAFSPDNREVCFARNVEPDRALSTNSDLWVVGIEGGEPRRLTTTPPGTARRSTRPTAAGSPTGRRHAPVSRPTASDCCSMSGRLGASFR